MQSFLYRHILSVTLGALALLLAACAPTYQFHGTQLDPPLALGTSTLTNQDGQVVQLDHYRGQWVLLFFGYTHCPDQCPLTLGQFKQIHDGLGAEASRVRFVLITVDPERDTPAQLKAYLAQFDPSFQGLTGSAAALVSLYRTLGIAVQAASQTDAASTNSLHSADPALQITHTSSVFMLDEDGKVRFIYTDVPWQDVTSDMRQMLHPPLFQ